MLTSLTVRAVSNANPFVYDEVTVTVLHSLASQLAWLLENEENINGETFIFYLDNDESLTPLQAFLPLEVTNLTIILRGNGAMRTISLAANGSLFLISPGITLVLDNNITLMGRADNTTGLVRIMGGNLIMNSGTKITGNTNTNTGGGVNQGSGIYVGPGGRFTMNGGEISGNTAANGAGGVHVAGTFYMHGGVIAGNTATGSWTAGGVHNQVGTVRISNGIIYGDDAPAELRNIAGANSHAAFVAIIGATTQRGTYTDGVFNSLGGFGTTRWTVHIINGIRQATELPQDLTGRLEWLRGNAQSNGTYTIHLEEDAIVSSQSQGGLPTGRTNLTIILRATGEMRTILHNHNLELFVIPSGVTLVLDENITLMGRGPLATPATAMISQPLIRVNNGGTLVMNKGSRITGHTNQSTAPVNMGGAIRIEGGGTFNMLGGEIARNSINLTGTTTHTSAGAIHNEGTFQISNGVIFGIDEAEENLRNIVTGTSPGHVNSFAVLIGNPAQFGTFSDGVFTRNGTLHDANFTIRVENGIAQIPQKPQDLHGQFNWVQTFAQDGENHEIVLNSDERITSAKADLPWGRKNLTVTLRATGGPWALSLDGNGWMFRVYDGLTFVLDENVTLVGHSTNNNHLVRVSEGGTLVMRPGSKITGNTNNAAAGTVISHGGGVRVFQGGTFNMLGGEISGNFARETSVSASTAAGLHNSGTFRMESGIIYGSEAPENLRNIPPVVNPGNGFAALFNNGTAQFGTFNGNTFTPNGSLQSADLTIHMINGVQQFPSEPEALADWLDWLQAFAQSGETYSLSLKNNETISPQTLATGRSNITITLRSDVPRTISILPIDDNTNRDGWGELFVIPNGVTLVLEENVTLIGLTGSGSHANRFPLVRVRNGGTLVMKEGSRITRNNNAGTLAADFGGGVRIEHGGTFNMLGGEISGNRQEPSGAFTNNIGGGVHNMGTFRISNGIIHGNNADAGLRNFSPTAAALFTTQGAVSQYGTFNNGAFTSNGNMFSFNQTVNVTNGVLEIEGRPAGFREQLEWLLEVAESGGTYTVEIDGDENIVPLVLDGAGRTDITINLRGIGEMRTVNLASNGILFTVGSGITLVLEENITLMGRRAGGNGNAPNNNNVVRITTGGTLVMNENTLITGNHNNATAAANIGGAVRVNTGGRFVMNGGEISGNTGAGNTGGVHIALGGTFEKRGGIIRNNHALIATGDRAGGVFNAGTFLISNGIIQGIGTGVGTANTTIGAAGDPNEALFRTAAAANNTQFGTFNGDEFTSNGTLPNSRFTINVQNGILQSVPKPEDFDGQILWVLANAQSNGNYTIELNDDVNIGPTVLSAPSGTTNVTITLRGIGEMRTVRLSSNGIMFTINSNVTIVLDENVTLEGRRLGGNGNANNNANLVRVEGGALVMNANSRITGNTNGVNVAADAGGGVRINNNGRFIMNGGTISGNTWAGNQIGGGVFIASGGTFEMRGGEIRDNHSSNNASQRRVGGVFIADGGHFRISNGIIHGSAAGAGIANTFNGNNGTPTAALSNAAGTSQFGTFNGDVFTANGILRSTNLTVNVQNGVVMTPVPESLGGHLDWIRSFAQNGTEHVIELNADAEVTNGQAFLAGSNFTVILRGTGGMRTIRLSANGIMFDVNNGATLVLDENITLQGRSVGGNGNANNNNVLVQVQANSAFVMNVNTRITGNTSTGTNGGAVRVLNNGRFTMNGGEIFGNTSAGATAGGVHIVAGGTFEMRGGIISNNHASVATGNRAGGVFNAGTFRISNGIIHGEGAGDGIANTVNPGTGGAPFAVLFNSGTAQHGTFVGAVFTELGNLTNRNDTIDVNGGVLAD